MVGGWFGLLVVGCLWWWFCWMRVGGWFCFCFILCCRLGFGLWFDVCFAACGFGLGVWVVLIDVWGGGWWILWLFVVVV